MWKPRVLRRIDSRERRLGALATDAAGKLDVLGHDGHTLGVDGAKVGVFEKANEVSLGGFLEGKDSRALEAKVSLEILGDFTDEALEGKLADKKLGGLLVSADFTKSDGTRAVSVGFLHAASGRGGFTGSLGGELLTGGFASGGFTCGLLGTGHFMFWIVSIDEETQVFKRDFEQSTF